VRLSTLRRITRRGELEMTTPCYRPDATYTKLVDVLCRTNDPDQVKIALGEIGDLWPQSILPDALDDEANARRLDWKRGLRS